MKLIKIVKDNINKYLMKNNIKAHEIKEKYLEIFELLII